ncbi:GGDEF domain-containing protein [Sphingomonas aerolata]|uniref:GGDEF domain-containing protein n=1 Tax=Sphingomonas aerolata TaxID=185951 RepID=UPI002FE2BB5A
MSGRPVIDEIGRFQGFIGTGFDLTEKRKADAEINRLALFDGLTGLANRQRMRLSLDKTLAQQAGPYRPTALFLMDLDRFKAVNDTLGHQAGDLLLKQVAQRLTRVVGDAGLVGRLGGDEFQVVLPGVDNRDTLSTLSRELILALSQPYFISGASVSIGCSIGIAITPQHGKDLGDADPQRRSRALCGQGRWPRRPPLLFGRHAGRGEIAQAARGRSAHRGHRGRVPPLLPARRQHEIDADRRL